MHLCYTLSAVLSTLSCVGATYFQGLAIVIHSSAAGTAQNGLLECETRGSLVALCGSLVGNGGSLVALCGSLVGNGGSLVALCGSLVGNGGSLVALCGSLVGNGGSLVALWWWRDVHTAKCNIRVYMKLQQQPKVSQGQQQNFSRREFGDGCRSKIKTTSSPQAAVVWCIVEVDLQHNTANPQTHKIKN